MSIEKFTPSVQKAIEQKRANKNNEAKSEIDSIKIAREANGDNPHTTSISTSVDTSRTGINHEIEKAEKALDTSLPTGGAKKSKNEEKEKATEETNKAIEAKNQEIIASWSEQGGSKEKDGVS